MSDKLLVYVSGPYSPTTEGDTDYNIRRARAICATLWDEGYAVICPHMNTAHFEQYSTASYEDYIAGDLRMVRGCDAMVMVPDWELSRGAKTEREYAEQKGIPVYEWPDRPVKPGQYETEWGSWPPEAFRPGLHPLIRLDPTMPVDEIQLVGPQPGAKTSRIVGLAAPAGYGEVRQFPTGATRDTDTGKFDYEAFISPAVLERYGRFMHQNRYQKDGTVRDGDNWQRGIPLEAYRKSLIRHVIEAWSTWRGARPTTDEIEQGTICAIMFNAMGMLHELLKKDTKEVRCE